MSSFNLDPVQKRLLDEILHRELSTLGGEIARTDSYEYRDSLKNRKKLVEDLLRCLETQNK